MANPPMDQPQRGRRDREMNDLPAEKAPGERENIRGVGEEKTTSSKTTRRSTTRTWRRTSIASVVRGKP